METLNEDDKDEFWEIAETERKGVVGFKSVAIIPTEAVRNVRLQKQPRVNSPRLVVRWTEKDSGHIAKTRGVCMG